MSTKPVLAIWSSSQKFSICLSCSASLSAWSKPSASIPPWIFDVRDRQRIPTRRRSLAELSRFEGLSFANHLRWPCHSVNAANRLKNSGARLVVAGRSVGGYVHLYTSRSGLCGKRLAARPGAVSEDHDRSQDFYAFECDGLDLDNVSRLTVTSLRSATHDGFAR